MQNLNEKNIFKLRHAMCLLAITIALLALGGCDTVDLLTEPARTPSPTFPAYTQEEPETSPRRGPVIITVQQAEEMMREQNTIILDVRTRQEFDNGHIQNAKLLPYSEIATMASAIIPDKSQTILIYCQSGRRSNIAAWALADMGYTAIYDFGGIADWQGAVVVP
ncbi:MAG: rhodanese-like domain-containing protein [Defluviitaleaceae bacterium]|nr:rhodanese-like domain-containing protein [Defluviitaleaceae bacterium]